MSAHSYWRFRSTGLMQDGGTTMSFAEMVFSTTPGGPNVATGGTPIASSEAVGLEATRAFDDNLATSWQSEAGAGAWIGYQFATPQDIQEITIWNSQDANWEMVPEAADIDRSDDGVEWTTTGISYSGMTWSEFDERAFAVSDVETPVATLFDTRLSSIINADSSIEVGAKLYWYESGTSTPVDTFTTEDLDVENSNPVVADADGRFPPIWLAPGSYKYILTAADSTPASPIFTQDPFIASTSQDLDVDPDLLPFLAGDEGLPVANGGTGPTLILPIANGGTGSSTLGAAKTALEIPPVATGAEVITGTNNTKFVSPLALADSVATTLTANGSRTSFDGWIVKWGTSAIGSGSNVVTGSVVFDVAFPTAAFSITGNISNAANGTFHAVVVGFPALSTTGFDFFADTTDGGELIDPGNSIRWIAIGH